METTFKYQNKIITTPNLEKKLKRMKISINDIELIEDTTSSKKEEVTYLYQPEQYGFYKYPDKESWLMCIFKDNLPETYKFNNQVLKLDREYTKKQIKKLFK